MKNMRKAKEALFAAVLFLLSGGCLAHMTSCYFSLSYGKGKVNYMGTTQLEDRLFSTEYVVGSYIAYPRSNPYSFGLGCELMRNIRFTGMENLTLEVTHREGLKADVISQVGVSGSYLGRSFESEKYEIRRHGELSGYSATLVGKWNIYEPIHATARIGAMYGKASLSVSSPYIPYSIEATRRVEGVVPIAGLGVMYEPKGQKWSFSIEGEKYYKYVTIVSAVIRIHF